MTRPSAVTCFNVYAVLMALLYLGLAALMVVAFLLSRNDPGMSDESALRCRSWASSSP